MEDSIFEFGHWGPMEFVVAAVVIAVTGLLLSWISRLTVLRGGGSHRLPPGPKGWPLIGALPYLGEFPHRSFYELSKKYGPVMYMRLGSVSVLVVSNGEMAKEVLKTNDQTFASRPSMLIATYLTYGNQDLSFTPYGPHWRQTRKFAISQLLTTSKLDHFLGIMKQEILNTVHIMLEQSQPGGKDGVTINFSTISNGMTMNVMTQMMWNKRHRNIKGSPSHHDEKFHELTSTLEAILGSDNIADFLPVFKSFAMKLSGLDKKAREVHKTLDEFCEGVICEKEQGLSKQMKPVADEDDFATTMLKLMNQPGDSQGLSRDKMKAILMDLMLAATDTSTVVLDWTFTELLRHPDMLRKVQDELTTVVGEDRSANESDIPHLKYLDAVFKEVLRVRTPSPLGLPHLSMADCRVGGYDVPANTMAFINQFAIHHDSTAWENPWEFNPDRFLQSEVDYKGQNFEYIPFGSGRRMCPGINLASTFLHLALAQFLHTVRWSLPVGQEPETLDVSEIPGLSIARATPLLLVAKPRLAHHVIYPTTA